MNIDFLGFINWRRGIALGGGVSHSEYSYQRRDCQKLLGNYPEPFRWYIAKKALIICCI